MINMDAEITKNDDESHCGHSNLESRRQGQVHGLRGHELHQDPGGSILILLFLSTDNPVPFIVDV